MTEQTKKNYKLAGGILLVVAMLAVTVWLMPWFVSLKDAAVREAFQQQVLELGWRGVLLMLGLQVLQVVVAILPGAVVELIAGATYGALGGLALCLGGGLFATIVIFYTVRAAGKGLVDRLFRKDSAKSLSLLNNTKKLEMFTFLLFFIPGTPKDLLTYVAPLTKIRARDFFIISTLGRIPAIISTTYTGNILMEGQWWKAILMFVLMGAVGLAGVWYYNTLMERAQSEKHGGKKQR